MIEVTIDENLKLRLYDTERKRVVKSLPKRGVDPEDYKRRKAQLAELKGSISATVKQRKKLLFEDFLSGRSHDVAGWRDAYLGNPVLKSVARLIVWQQAESTFTVLGEGLVDSLGREYALSNEAVFVAHPLEMEDADVKAWREYFASRSLKQPFAQIWEAVVDGSTVRPDRYASTPIPFYRFKGREAHGITARKNSYGEGASIRFADCMTRVNWLDQGVHRYIGINDRFEIESFEFFRYTRQVNHIVTYLDRVCLYPRIEANDLTVMDDIADCTLEQLIDYVSIASRAGALELSASMLAFREQRFGEFNGVESLLL